MNAPHSRRDLFACPKCGRTYNLPSTATEAPDCPFCSETMVLVQKEPRVGIAFPSAPKKKAE